MNRDRVKEILKKGFKIYLVYVFIFAILIFAIQKPKENDAFFQNDYSVEENINKDRAELIESGKDGALVRLNLIENAEESIDISYYTLIGGMSTDLILGSIINAADKGVEVRILLDGVFNNLKGDLKDSIYGFQLHPNIELKLYEPIRLLSPLNWNNRLHDKIILVDKELGLIGGRNIGDKYFREDIEKDNFVKDRDALIFRDKSLEGSPSVIDDMVDYYDSIWDYEYSKVAIESLTSREETKGKAFNEKLRSEYGEFKKEYESDLKPTDWYENTMETDGIRFVFNPIGRINQDPWCLRELLILASQAEESIFIQSPYIIPSRNMKSKFNQYDIDYGKITMLTNSLASSPNPLAIAGYTNSKEEIVDGGVEVYEYQGPKSIHSKTYIIDEYKSVIGSFNFDARSTYINTESIVIISGEKFAAKLKDNIQVDLNNSLKVDKDYSYIEDDNIKEGEVSIFVKIITKILSKVVFFVEYLL